MNAALIAAVVAALAQNVVVPAGFGRPWFARPAVKVHTLDTLQGVTIGKIHIAPPIRSCHMPMARPGTDVDPKIVVEPPKGVAFAIRTIEVPCK